MTLVNPEVVTNVRNFSKEMKFLLHAILYICNFSSSIVPIFNLSCGFDPILLY